MKEYKHTYCASLLYSFVKAFIVFFPTMILLAIIAHTEGYATFWQIFGAYWSAFAIFWVAIAVFILLVSVLIGLFANKTALLTDTYISYPGQTLRLDDIRYITLYLPELKGRYSSAPFELTLWVDDKNSISIKHPSFRLVAALKKRCPMAVFYIDDWKVQLKECMWIQLGIVAIAVIAIIFGSNK